MFPSVTERGGVVFQIKICGITRPEDALLAVEAGADAVGLNFYARSPRYVDFATAEKILAALPSGVVKVGVFVNATADEASTIFDRLGLDAIQLHGDEPASFGQRLSGRPVIRALRCGEPGLAPLVDHLRQCQELAALPQAVLVDALAAGHYGGSGQMPPWELLQPPRPWLAGRPLILAGGLTPANVANAIEQVVPAGVDTASGVESAPGIKDPARLKAFIHAARRAFASFPPTY